MNHSSGVEKNPPRIIKLNSSGTTCFPLRITDFPTTRTDYLTNLTDIVIKIQEKFYRDVFGITVDFSCLSDLLKKVDIPSENMTVFISDSLSDEKLFSVVKKILGFEVDIPKIQRNVKRESLYIISMEKKLGEEKHSISLPEMFIMELFLRTKRNTFIANYLPGPLLCRGTRFFMDKDLKFSNPFLNYNKFKKTYSIGFVRGNIQPEGIKAPVVSVYR